MSLVNEGEGIPLLFGPRKIVGIVQEPGEKDETSFNHGFKFLKVSMLCALPSDLQL